MTHRLSSRPPTPGGTRPPPPPMAPRLRLLAWMLLIAALALLLWQGEIRAWAALQLAPATPTPDAATPFPNMPALTPILIAARAIQDLLRPPLYDQIVISVITALGLLGGELGLLLVLPAIRVRYARRATRVLLCVRALPLAGDAAGERELLRSLHALLPVRPLAALVGRAPELALTLHGQPGAPVTLGIALAAPTPAQLRELVTAVRAAIIGHAPDAVVAAMDDPIAPPPPAFTQADREPPPAPPRAGPLFPEADDAG